MRIEPPAVGSLELDATSATPSSASSVSSPPAARQAAPAAAEAPAAVVAESVAALNARAVDADASRAAHVARIAADVRSGSYRVDLRKLAERMISEDGGRLRRLLGEE
jgi:anti-sigma28 factor (negative regulator of flagellin synthesis)